MQLLSAGVLQDVAAELKGATVVLVRALLCDASLLVARACTIVHATACSTQPAVTVGNVGELAVDVCVSSLMQSSAGGLRLVAWLEDDLVLPVVGADALTLQHPGMLTTATELFQVPGMSWRSVSSLTLPSVRSCCDCHTLTATNTQAASCSSCSSALQHARAASKRLLLDRWSGYAARV